MTKRILHVISALDGYGTSTQLATLARGLCSSDYRNEYDVHICALAQSGSLAQQLRCEGIPTTQISTRTSIDLCTVWPLWRHLVRLRPDLVHTWLHKANCHGRAAALAGGVKHLVASFRCVTPDMSSHQRAIERLLARTTDAIVANSRAVLDFCLDQGLAEEKIVVIPNGVSPAQPSDVSRQQLLEELHLPGSSRLVGAVGPLLPRKNMKHLIWATDLLKSIRDDVHLLIIGEGPHRNRLEKFCRQLKIEDRVHFLGHRDDLPRWLGHLDVLWQASSHEGMPNAIMQAMVAAVPVVATDIPGNRDLVVPGETGFLVPVGHRADFGRYTHKLLDHRQLAEQLGQAGRKRMLEKFSVGTMVQSYASLYRRLLS